MDSYSTIFLMRLKVINVVWTNTVTIFQWTDSYWKDCYFMQACCANLLKLPLRDMSGDKIIA